MKQARCGCESTLLSLIVDDDWDIERQNTSRIGYITDVHIEDRAVILTYTCDGRGRDDMTAKKT